MTLATVLTHPGVFGKALIESPSLLIGDGQLLKDAEKATQFPQRMFLAIGTAEEADEKASAKDAEAVRDLEKILRAKGLGPNRLKVVVEEGAHHDERRVVEAAAGCAAVSVRERYSFAPGE